MCVKEIGAGGGSGETGDRETVYVFAFKVVRFRWLCQKVRKTSWYVCKRRRNIPQQFLIGENFDQEMCCKSKAQAKSIEKFSNLRTVRSTKEL